MAAHELLEQARAAFSNREWRNAHACYSQARSSIRLERPDVEQFAVAAHLFGRESESREIFAGGYRACVDSEDFAGAARFAFWVSQSFIFHGDGAQSNAWLGRARAALEQCDEECVERAYVTMLESIGHLIAGDVAAAEQGFGSVIAGAGKYRDATLAAMGGHGRARALVGLGRFREAMDLLDEVMVAATEGEVSPLIVGDTYCGALEACHDVFDVRRAREWTSALSRWCEAQTDLVPYRGPCLIHRVELMRLAGDWVDAIEEAQRACEWLANDTSPEGPGDALYELAELLRLRGEFERAEQVYQQAVRHGRPAEPGVQLLWLARGQAEAAQRALARALEEPGIGAARRAELLSVYCEVLLARGDPAARTAALELRHIAETFEAPLVAATADAAEGRVLLANGSFPDALALLKRAWSGWQQLRAPFEAARVRVNIAAAYRALGDAETAAMELDAARWVFEQLGAQPELQKLGEVPPPQGVPTIPVTPREREVLRLIAAGHTNREIAASLVISEHTVARHVQNMLSRLGFTSRTRLAAYAAEQGIAAVDGQS